MALVQHAKPITVEPVLTVAVLNDIFKSRENMDVFEMPKSYSYDEDDSDEVV